jgi:hypothetical protein
MLIEVTSAPKIVAVSSSQTLVPVYQTVRCHVGSEVLTAVVMNSSLLWDITPCSPLKVNQRFEGTCRLHLQGPRISRTRNQRGSNLLSRWFIARFILRPWKWRRRVSPKRRFTFNGLHGILSQKIQLFTPYNIPKGHNCYIHRSENLRSFVNRSSLRSSVWSRR